MPIRRPPGPKPRHGSFRLAGLSASVFIGACAVRPPKHSREPVLPCEYDLIYTLCPQVKTQPTFLEVTLAFRGNRSGETRLVLPLEWGGQDKLYRDIADLRVVSRGASLEETEEPHVRLVQHASGAVISISYRVLGPHRETGIREGLHYRPIIRDHYFFVVGQALWVYPECEESAVRRMRFHWEGIPRVWTLGNSFGLHQRRQSVETNIDSLRRGLYFAGDFRIQTLSIREHSVHVATRGTWSFDEQEFTELLHSIIEVERDFFDDHDFPYFLVTMLPTNDEAGHIQGEGRTQGFALFVSEGQPDLVAVDEIIAHEMFHAWNPRRMGTLNDERLYWFSEGFTDYFASLLLLRAGLRTTDDHVRWINRVLREYYESDARNLTADQMVVERRASREAGRLPYRQGTLLALNWEAMLRDATGSARSLEDVMRKLVQRPDDQELTTQAIVEPFEATVAERVRKDLQLYIAEGKTILPRADAFAPQFELAQDDVAQFDPGFDLEGSFRGKVISGVRPDSSAVRAGLRNGQRLIEGGMAHDPQAEAEITVEDNGVLRQIKYQPASTLRIPQFEAAGAAP